MEPTIIKLLVYCYPASFYHTSLDERNMSDVWYGYGPAFLDLVRYKVPIEYEMVYLQDLPDSNITTVKKQLAVTYEGLVDVVPLNFAVTAKRAEYVSYSHPLDFFESKFLMWADAPSTYDPLQQVFDEYVWLSVLVTWALSTIAMLFLMKIQNHKVGIITTILNMLAMITKQGNPGKFRQINRE